MCEGGRMSKESVKARDMLACRCAHWYSPRLRTTGAQSHPGSTPQDSGGSLDTGVKLYAQKTFTHEHAACSAFIQQGILLSQLNGQHNSGKKPAPQRWVVHFTPERTEMLVQVMTPSHSQVKTL